MSEKQPKIIANGLSNEELYKWFKSKVTANLDLKVALAEKQSLMQAINEIDVKIELLTARASLEVIDS
ncbi:hypothetical protein ZK68_004774 [Salmonella enterica subsp. enterica]|nr:hypothetical protein [Salmonella enterica subsp. enterica]